MRRRRTPLRALIPVAFFLAAVLGLRAEPGAPIAPRAGVPRLGERLAALTPERPVEYFELAEEVAYELGPDGAALARTLFVLAYECERRAGGPATLAPSICLALADLSVDAEEQRWLRAMARGLRAGDGPAESDLTAAPARDPVEAHRAAADILLRATIEYLALEPRAARELIRRPDVQEAIEYWRTRSRVLDRLVAETKEETACVECRNRRVVRASIDAPGSVRLCPRCGGNPGPRLGAGEYAELLRWQAALARVEARSWSADVLLREGLPLRDADPAALAPRFGVEPEKSVWKPPPDGDWRKGWWTAPAAAAAQPPGVSSGP